MPISSANPPQAARPRALRWAALGHWRVALAFADFGTGSSVNWLQLASGDLAVKAAMAVLLLAPYRALLPRLQAWAVPMRQDLHPR